MTRVSPSFRSTQLGCERLNAGSSIPRHRHRHGYIAVVLAGGYQEAGLSGRLELKAGDVVVHRPFDAHLDYIGGIGADVLNLPLPVGAALPTLFRIDDPDAAAKLAERDPHAAALALVPVGSVVGANDWVDELAASVVESPGERLADWGAARGLAAETLSRAFSRAYGVTPARFRAEARTQRALYLVVSTDLALANIAADCGFADQPHLTRAVTQLTGCSPGQWRQSNSFKTEGDERS